MNSGRATTAVLALLLSLLVLSVAWAEVIGKTTLPLDSRAANKGESALGDVVADSFRAAALNAGQNADAAFVLAQQLRPQLLPAGDVTRESLAKTFVFPDEQIVTIGLKGSEIRRALEWSLSFAPRPSASLLQVSGMTVTYRPDASSGPRVTEITLGGAPLVADRTYWVAMPLTLAKGALGYYRIFGAREIKQTGTSLQEALVKYVQTTGTITVAAGSRLRVQTPSPAPK